MENNGWIETQVELRNKHGLHMRPAQQVVATASEFKSEIQACAPDYNANAKSILDMIEFAAQMVNHTNNGVQTFVFRARGDDAAQALEALQELVEKHFGED
jgi:phosphotransferase system HPr (HPr) family protein